MDPQLPTSSFSTRDDQDCSRSDVLQTKTQRVCGRSPPMTSSGSRPETCTLRVCYQTAFAVLEFLARDEITPDNIEARLWGDEGAFRRLLAAARLRAAFEAHVRREGASSRFCAAVCELVRQRLAWAARQVGPRGTRLLAQGAKKGGRRGGGQAEWEWHREARRYSVLLGWFEAGERS